MTDYNGNFDEIDDLLKGALNTPIASIPVTLRQRFEKRAEELKIG